MYVVRIARINVYLPDDLASAARHAGLHVSSLTQSAVRAALAGNSTTTWLSTLDSLPSGDVPHERVFDALDQARNDPAAPHG